LWGLKVYGREKVPNDGAVILAVNHRSFLDPPVVAISLRREIYFAAKKELFKIFIVGSLIRYLNSVPVRRTGFDNEALKKFIDVLKKDKMLLMFPEGTRSRQEGMLPFKRGIGYLVAKTGAAVQPMYISGSDKLRNNFLHKRSIKAKFGDPIYGLAEMFGGNERYDAIAGEIQTAVEKLEAESIRNDS
jgi:1-acyl-sn-glycerol-3-phosphate acyltransferase